MSSSLIDTEKFSSVLRNKGIDLLSKRILMTKFSDSEQAKDLTLPPNCNGFGRIHHFKRSMGVDYPLNPLPIDPALKALNLPREDTIQVQVFQNAICSWRCWYCFVDFSLLSADPKHSEFKSVEELIDLYLTESHRPPIIDLSGGQPDLVPEWNLWFADEINRRGLSQKVYLWSDDNLSNDYLWRYLTRQEIARLASYKNYGRVGCFKGFDNESFSFNTKARPELFDQQFTLMQRLVENGFDVYGYATFTSPSDKDLERKMKVFMDKLQSEVHELFPLRTVPLRIFEFTPTRQRTSEDHFRALEVQKRAIDIWTSEIVRRFDQRLRSKMIFEHKLI
ncbi:MAG TPA: hypothetical protein VL728_06630 [Cyclobacteriaceae bacterium]|jgi:uncharacterized Fe-S cluster-containing radical SAM superfamily protein|nr:hypothetical protein [Cyclobacteriaceae bacterium]